MKLLDVKFDCLVYNPANEDTTCMSWTNHIHGPAVTVEKQGDFVLVVHPESGRSQVYSWTHVTSATPVTVPTPPTAKKDKA